MQLRALNWERREGEEGGRELAGFLRSRVETGALSTGCWIPRRLVTSTFTLWCGRHRGPGTWKKWSPRLTIVGGQADRWRGQEWQAGSCYLASFRGPRGGRDCREVLCSFLGMKHPRCPGCSSPRLAKVRRYGRCGVERPAPLREDISPSPARCLCDSS